MSIQTVIKRNEKLAGRILLAGGLYLTVLRPLLQKFNVVDTKEEAEAKKEAERARKQVEIGTSISPYNFAAFFSEAAKKNKKPLIFTTSSTDLMVKNIRFALNYYNLTNMYDEKVVFGILEACKTQSQWAWICKAFNLKYASSLYEFLKDNLTPAEFSSFNVKLLSKPLYTI